MVTGSITIANTDPRQFCQTFFLARQHQDNDRHNYFVRNAIFRFLDVLPEVVQVLHAISNTISHVQTHMYNNAMQYDATNPMQCNTKSYQYY